MGHIFLEFSCKLFRIGYLSDIPKIFQEASFNIQILNTKFGVSAELFLNYVKTHVHTPTDFQGIQKQLLQSLTFEKLY